MKINKVMKFALVFLALVFVTAASLFAAEAVTGEPVAAPVAQTVKWWVLVIPIAVPLVLGIAKSFVPKIPGWMLPVLAPLMGAAADYFASGTFGQGTAMGVIAGSAGVGVRELADQIMKRLKEPSNDNDVQTPDGKAVK